jgi:hypothetical protein
MFYESNYEISRDAGFCIGWIGFLGLPEIQRTGHRRED